MRTSVAVAFVALALVPACQGGAASRARAPAPLPPPPSSPDAMEPQLRAWFCKPGSVGRACFAVPDDAGCVRLFDEAWRRCTRDVVVHPDAGRADYEAGRRTGRCVADAFAETFGPSDSPACQDTGDQDTGNTGDGGT